VTHPIELLADEVDGTLGPDDRASLSDHLQSCASCRDDVRSAAAARTALRSMPAVDAPDLAAGFTPERIAALRMSTRRDAPADDRVTVARPPWSRLVPALAAAAVVGAVAIILPGVMRSQEPSDRAGAPAAETAVLGETDVLVDETDYDEATLDRLAGTLATTIGAHTGSASAPSAAEVAGEPGAAVDDQLGQAAKAAACLQEAFPGGTGRLVELRRAAYEGEPAYLGVVVEGEEPAVVVTIRVAAIDGCARLALTSQAG
jgi:hypothetical protein